MSDATLVLPGAGTENPPPQELLPLVYDELRRLAAARLAWERPGQTLQATALVHEAYMRLVGSGDNRRWVDSRHFYFCAAKAMKYILIEKARRAKETQLPADSLDLTAPGPDVDPIDILALDDALERLHRIHPRKAEVVHLRYFAGLTLPEVARSLGLALSTVENDWAYARSWLKVEMSADEDR